MTYKVKLVYKPDQANEAALAFVKKLDSGFFPGCAKEPLKETYWWLVYADDEVIGYAGMRYLGGEGFGYFCRAGILEKHRGQGLHKRLIATRIKMAKRLGWNGVLTYVSSENPASMNALISRGFRMYTPEWKWAGKEFMYLKKEF